MERPYHICEVTFAQRRFAHDRNKPGFSGQNRPDGGGKDESRILRQREAKGNWARGKDGSRSDSGHGMFELVPVEVVVCDVERIPVDVVQGRREFNVLFGETQRRMHPYAYTVDRRTVPP